MNSCTEGPCLNSFLCFVVRGRLMTSYRGTFTTDYRVSEASGSWKGGESVKGRTAWSHRFLASGTLSSTQNTPPWPQCSYCHVSFELGALLVFVFMSYSLILKLNRIKALSLMCSWEGSTCVNGSLCTQGVYYLNRERIGICVQC